MDYISNTQTLTVGLLCTKITMLKSLEEEVSELLCFSKGSAQHFSGRWVLTNKITSHQ